MSREFPKNKNTAKRNEKIVEAHENSNEESKKDNPPGELECAVMKSVLVNTGKKVYEASQRKSLFRTRCCSGKHTLITDGL